ncbi:FAD-binding oxidoreductase [Virgibacillus sp. W0181]|uniref:FAD-binding oxidoreductase n=1 Tax=Virgibacillus sp. W0181 TaxID=3391581 RepID=UPI003F4885A1
MIYHLLVERLGKAKVSNNETVRERHSHDESPHQPVKPDVVCFPSCREDVETIMEIARSKKIPVTPFGIGSGLEGQAIPLRKGISISFEQMNQVVDFSPEDMTVIVEPGITRTALNKIINRHGLMFPIDPGAEATIGGMAATNASGTTAVRYGSMREQILDLEVVLADGAVIHTGSRAKKSSSGYHLTGLFTGSEGTLGIITKITLRLHGIPEQTAVASCTFSDIKDCAEAAQLILQSGIDVMRMEFVDQDSIEQVNKYGNYRFPVAHSLFLELAGTNITVDEEMERTRELMEEVGCSNWKVATDSSEKKEIWKARHELSYAYTHTKGMKDTGADVCVPISRLPDLIVFARKLLDESGLIGGVLGHIGDGNFHTIVLFNPEKPGEREIAEKTNEELTSKAIEVGGTCTGEHGVGLGKMKFQEREHGAALSIMKNIKKIMDPEGLLNPGKIFYT